MEGYRQQNRATIKRGFRWLEKSEGEIVKKGMVALAEAGLSYLVDAHRQHAANMMHTTEDDTLAYAVAHDGVIVSAGSHNGSGGEDMPGDAINKARALLTGTSGWVAIILSEMEGWYRLDYENGFLQYSADEIRANFNQFFKPVAQ